MASGTTTQVSIAYSLGIPIPKMKIKYSSYFDFVLGDEGSQSTGDLIEFHWHSSHQFLLDLGGIAGASDSLMAGVEYQIWAKKYGIQDGPDENNLKWIVKFNL